MAQMKPTDSGAMDSAACFYHAGAGSIPAGRAMQSEDWQGAECMPSEDGEYLCWVCIPRQHHGRQARMEHYRYMALEFVDGGFWIHGGMPNGMVKAWIKLSPPSL
jgi:hypothetical protein